jgi:hypothetical protein
MSLLMTNTEEKAAQRAAANEEIERLCALPVAELAAEILPAWAPAKRSLSTRPAHDVAEWLMAPYPRSPVAAELYLAPAVEEAIQALEHAGLLIRRFLSGGASTLDLTRLGWAALAQGDARRYLTERARAFPAGPADPVAERVPASVVALARTRRTAEAVQRHREMTGADLRRAEFVVRALTLLPPSRLQ